MAKVIKFHCWLKGTSGCWNAGYLIQSLKLFFTFSVLDQLGSILITRISGTPSHGCTEDFEPPRVKWKWKACLHNPQALMAISWPWWG